MVRPVVAFSVLLLSVSTTANATTSWALKSVTLADGGLAIGFFSYDPTIGAVTDWQISVVGGDTSTFSSTVYDPANSVVLPRVGGPGFTFRIALAGAARDFRIGLAASLPTSGYVTVPLGPTDNMECFNCSPARSITSGTLHAVDVWFLNGVRFADGGWALGGFAYDPTTGEVPWWSLQTFSGNEGTFPPVKYDPLTSVAYQSPGPGALGSFVFRIFDSGSGRDLKLGPAKPLQRSSAIFVRLDLSNTVTGVQNLECFNCSPLRMITAGVVTNPQSATSAANVPTLSIFALLVLACCLLVTALIVLCAR